MRKILSLVVLTTLAGCATHPTILPPPPTTTQVVEQKIAIPVLCRVELQRAKVRLDSMESGQPLEEQNAALRQSIAEQKAYVIQLEAGIIGCGGKIK